ncbi:TPA: hypothetical protein ACN331_002526 [Vibrio parahaemolyticus]|jgi:hypothetical protein|uniref:hypothetical protein n=1 Tax=Vibrio parahaemolyticus TaxID=670 RepID=UPI0015D43A9D|nr:hypothetical protein [Vibrio parahaemolyticus]NYU23740.1 hypothetical protein [Vibrio parahaemolyticus]
MAKTHLNVPGVDARDSGQTQFEFTHQTACGFVREQVTTNKDSVDCFYCLRSEEMKHHFQLNKTVSDS